ncbi:MAG: acyl carrier protein, partial [Xenococcus sp. MO_188.B8]|nr:acyl carrier protein [Xenococcus sp. MO_188.B8]
MVLEVLPDVNLEDLSEDSDIFSMGLDSINAMILVTKLQEAFEIQLDTSEINFENFQNLGTIVELIENKERSE